MTRERPFSTPFVVRAASLALLVAATGACKKKPSPTVGTNATPSTAVSSTVDSADAARREKAAASIQKAQALINAGKYDEARKLLAVVIDENGGTKEAFTAEDQLKDIETLEEAKTAPETIKKMKATRAFEDILGTKIGVGSVSTTRRWVYGNFGTGSFSKDAAQEATYVVVEFDVMTTAPDPQLPCVHAFLRAPDGLRFMRLGKPLAIEFRRWDSYGSTLGNYDDNGNDFAKSETVKFTAGTEVTLKSLSTKVLYIGFSKRPHVQRVERDNRPPIYSLASCPQGPKEISVGDLTRDYEIAEIRAPRPN